MRSLFILIVVFVCIQCTTDHHEIYFDPIQPTVPVTGLQNPVNFQVLRAPENSSHVDFSGHSKSDFIALVAEDGKHITAGVLQYFHEDCLPARFLCFYPKADRLTNGIAYFVSDGSSDIIYAPVAYAGTIENPNPDFGFHFQHKMSRIQLSVRIPEQIEEAGLKVLSAGIFSYDKLSLELGGQRAGELLPEKDAVKTLFPGRLDNGMIPGNVTLTRDPANLGTVYVFPGEDLKLLLQIEGKKGTFASELQLAAPQAGQTYRADLVYDPANEMFSASLNDWVQGASFEAQL